MDKRHGRSDKQYGAGPKMDRKTDRQSDERRRRYPRPRPDRQFTNIDDYLADRDAKFGKTFRTEQSEHAWQAETSRKFHEAGHGGADRAEVSSGAEQSGNTDRQKRSGHSDRGGKQRSGEKNSRREQQTKKPEREGFIEGRNAVLEAFRSGREIDKLFVQRRLQDGPISSILRLARKRDVVTSFVPKERLDQMSADGHHQGVIASVASYEYVSVEEILHRAKEKGEEPYLFLLDGIEDPHNLGAIIRTANLAGAHGVVIPKHRAAGLTATVAKASAGALNYTPVAKVANLASVIDQLKRDGMWFVCADMDGTNMYDLAIKGAVGLIIGNEGQGVGRLLKERCDFTASIPMHGEIDSLNASVAAGILGFEIARQRSS